MVGDHGPEQTIKEVEANSEICIHAPEIIHTSVMNVMKPSDFQEPWFDQGNAGHPEIPKVHAIMKIAEGENTRENERAGGHNLINERYMKQSHCAPAKRENHSRRSKPFKAHIAERKTLGCGVLVLFAVHGTLRSINHEMMDHVRPAEKWQFVAVE